MDKPKILLLGGDGFLGKGLQREFKARSVDFTSLDMKDVDLTDPDSVGQIALTMTEYSHVVHLASIVGIEVFNSEPEYGAAVNAQIYKNFIKALNLAYDFLQEKTGFDVTFYSTSEVFGGMRSKYDYITNDSPYRFDRSSQRYLYSKTKTDMEKKLAELKKAGKLRFLKILRPFNISGKGQKRGVLYEMIKSAALSGKIKYMFDTTRSITDIDFASAAAADCILAKRDVSMNIVDNCSVELETIARRIAEYFGNGVELEEIEPDKYMRYRQVSKIESGNPVVNRKLDKIIDDIASENGWRRRK